MCTYKKAVTGEYTNQNDVTFGSRMATVDNPIKLTFGWWPVCDNMALSIIKFFILFSK